MPKASVLMSVYNGESYLRRAIDSVLSQTYRDYEFIIVDDASTDATPRIIGSYRDPRVRVIRNEHNVGLTRSLNKAIYTATGKYIIRMDADDVSLLGRFEKQVRYMESHPQTGVCGSWMRLIGAAGGYTVTMPTDDAAIRCYLLFNTYLAHPTVIIRRNLFDNGLCYDATFDRAQDYELWSRAADVTRFANYPEALLLYTTYESGRRRVHQEMQVESNMRVHKALLGRLGITPTQQELDLHLLIGRAEPMRSTDAVFKAHLWLKKIYAANLETDMYDVESFSTMLSRQWYRICTASALLGRDVWRCYKESTFSMNRSVVWRERKALQVQCMLQVSRGHRLSKIFKYIRSA